MKYLLTLFFLSFFFSSCTESTTVDPLEAARQKLAAAKSISFKLSSVWNNTFVGDTVVDDPHYAVYIRNDGSYYPYDFAYDMGTSANVYKSGELLKYNIEKKRTVTFDEEQTQINLDREGSYSTGKSIFKIANDTTWVRAEKIGHTVIYERVDYESNDEEGHAYAIERLHIDSVTSEITTKERIYTLAGKPQQHLVYAYSKLKFNQSDSISFVPPEGFSEVSQTDLDKIEEKGALKPGDEFPVFDLVSVDGESYSSESVLGKKLVFAFSFIGCGGCEYARKELKKANFKLKDEYLGFYVNPTNPTDQIINYHADKPWPFTMASVDYGFTEKHGVYVYPTFIAVDETGKVTEVVEGYEEGFFAGKGK